MARSQIGNKALRQVRQFASSRLPLQRSEFERPSAWKTTADCEENARTVIFASSQLVSARLMFRGGISDPLEIK
jgi:hypothetical protein